MDPVGGRKTALFVSELRDDPGFAAPLLCIADELVRLAARDGFQLRTVFVLSDPLYYGYEAASHGHMVLPAPATKRPIEINSRGRSYANRLATIGFAHERELGLLLQAWDRLFALLSPDVIVADNSPSACVAARGRIPVLITGSGFSAPPADVAVFPPIAGDGRPETNQTVIRDVVNRVLHARGAPPIGNLPELLAGGRRAVFAVPQLDPYRAHRSEKLLSPCIGIEGPLEPCDAPSIFFALPSTLPNLTGVVRALERAGAAMSCYVPGPGTIGLTLLSEIGARIFETRPNLEQVLPDAAVVLTASADLASSAYLAGRPQLVLRADLEASAMAAELEKRHTAIALELTEVDKLTSAIRELLHNSSYAVSAREEARRAKEVATRDSSATIAARACVELMTSSCSAGVRNGIG
jgi:UDP:flavonoid glycosyltransferase YjiC (YdhE family)